VTTLVPALLCAAIIGFAAHRASLCNVRAVAEVMTQRSAHMLRSLLQAALWACLVGGLWTVVAGQTLASARVPAVLTWSVLGGFLFGVGAAVNGGCSLSTLHRLVDGEVGMLATLVGFAVGVSLDLALAPWVGSTRPLEWVASPAIWSRWPNASPWVLAMLVIWAARQALALKRAAQSASPRTWRHSLLAPTYSLAGAAALMGVSAGVLYAAQGAWSYTNHLRTSVLHGWTGSAMPSASHSSLVLALLAGMLLSAWQRRSLAWRPPQRAGVWLRHLGGGVLMGAGAAMVPGGNDTLLLKALPTLALQAVAAYASLLAGIATVLWAMRRAQVSMPGVACSPAGCREVSPPAERSRHEEAAHVP